MIHGGKIVFFGRFISFLRAWAAFFAGVNNMEWRRFLLYNAAGGITWASFYGILGFTFGKHVHAFSMPIRYGFLSLGILYLVISTIYFRHNFRSLEKKAKNSIK